MVSEIQFAIIHFGLKTVEKAVLLSLAIACPITNLHTFAKFEKCVHFKIVEIWNTRI
jgi:hypothetical protein